MGCHLRWAVRTFLAITLGGASVADAALVSRLGGQAVYDTDLDLTWLANANLAQTNTFGVPGINASGTMTWDTANSFIDAMNVANYLGFSGWRLPPTLQPDATCGQHDGVGDSFGPNCTGSEMGHLFYTELGGVSGQDINTTHNANYNLFQNIIATDSYLSSTEYKPNPTVGVWAFSFGTGVQFATNKDGGGRVFPVLPGDVVPEPGSALLLGVGILTLVVFGRRGIRASRKV